MQVQSRNKGFILLKCNKHLPKTGSKGNSLNMSKTKSQAVMSNTDLAHPSFCTKPEI